MICPRCGTTQPDAADCVRCGVVVAKFLERRQKAEQPDFRPPPPPRHLVQASAPPSPGPQVGSPSAQSTSPPPPAQVRSLPLGRWHDLWATRPPPHRHRVLLLQQLGRLSKAGVPLPEALATVRGVVGPGRLGAALATAEERLAAGQSLDLALQALGSALDPVERQLLVAAEPAGRLGPVAERLAERRDLLATLGQPLRAALTYPALVAASSCVLGPIPMLVTHGPAAYAAQALGNLLLLGLAGATALVAVPWVLALPKVRQAWLGLCGSVPGARGLLANRRFLLVFDTAARALEAGMTDADALRLATGASDEKRVVQAAEAQAKKLPLDGLTGVLADLPGLDRESAGLLAAARKSDTVPVTLAELAQQRLERYRGQMRLMAGGLKAALIVVLLLAMSASIIGKFTDALTNPLGGMQGAEQQELQRELQRAGLPVR